jgi:hypothetical protein
MTEIAQASGMTRESLYKSLRADAQPRFETLANVLMALGLKFSIEPLGPKAVTRKVASKSPVGTKKTPRKAGGREKRSTAHAQG